MDGEELEITEEMLEDDWHRPVSSVDAVPEAPEVLEELEPEEYTPTGDEPWQLWYVGTVKGYSLQDGWGFIECKKTFEQYGMDVFLRKQEIEPIRRLEYTLGGNVVGKPVCFSVRLDSQGRPRAIKVTRCYAGTVKSFSEKQGFGFLTGPETRHVMGGDIFLHKTQAEEANAKVGDAVSFSVHFSTQGRAQARQLSPLDFDLFGADALEDIPPPQIRFMPMLDEEASFHVDNIMG